MNCYFGIFVISRLRELGYREWGLISRSILRCCQIVYDFSRIRENLKLATSRPPYTIAQFIYVRYFVITVLQPIRIYWLSLDVLRPLTCQCTYVAIVKTIQFWRKDFELEQYLISLSEMMPWFRGLRLGKRTKS